MGLLDRIATTGIDPNEPVMPYLTGRWLTLARASERIAAGGDVLMAVRDVLDQVAHIDDDLLAELVHERPALTGDARADALLGAIAEHLAATRGLDIPRWCQEPNRFLDQFWFVSTVPGFRAQSLAQSPVALKRRGILWPARSLVRI